uniref:Uncharacterized protein n=1 Tax=Musa acuminata subsp. malaccensis TaxID=214687 RepID=A0A804J5M2_MUSAM
MQQLRLLLAGKRGRHRCSPFTAIEEAVRECDDEGREGGGGGGGGG